MKRLAIILVLLLSFNLTTFGIEIEGLKMHSTILGKDIHFSVILPQDYSKGGKSRYPTLYMLHGLGDNYSSWLEYGGVAQIAQSMVRDSAITPFIIIIPQGDSDYYSNFESGNYNYQNMFTEEFVPYIDNLYRTRNSAGARAVAGYSMGGFGALMLPWNNPDVFGASIALSASIRTQEQYIAEPQREWNQQWGRIFGAQGTTGSNRLTPYYVANSPVEVAQNRGVDSLKRVALFIDNGDQEGTLCASNELLHMALLERGVPHVYNVRSGGHTFEFWRSALPEAFRFADAQFREVEFKPTNPIAPLGGEKGPVNLYNKQAKVEKQTLELYYPIDADANDRLFATVYITGYQNKTQQNSIARHYTQGYERGVYPAMMLCFVPDALRNSVDKITAELEARHMARPGRRYRSMWITGDCKIATLEQVFRPNNFTACVLTNSVIDATDEALAAMVRQNRKANNNLHLWLDTPSHGAEYQNIGLMHIILRENEFVHQYRARNYSVEAMDLMPQTLEFISKRIHH